MAKISDYSISDILNAAGVETMKTGNNIVCRCPICHANEPLRKDNFEAQINDNNDVPTLFCHSCGKAYNRTELINILNLYDVLGIERYDNNNYRPQPQRPVVIKKKEKPAPAPVVAPAIIDKAEIERLLSLEIPQVLWDKTTKSFKDIALTTWNKQKRLLFVAPNGSTITRNSGTVKWKWAGSQPIFNRLTGKSIVFLASGVAEWLILDWLGFDYIVLPSDSLKARLAGFKEKLKDKGVVIMPDHDKTDHDKNGSFDKVIDTVKQVAERVHICSFYQDHDFRDYCRRTAPAFDSKEQFIDSLLYNVFIELGGSENAEQVSEKDIFSLIPISQLPQQTEAAEPQQAKEQEPDDDDDDDLFDLTKMFVKPEPLKFIFSGFRESTVGIFAGAGGSGKSYMSLAFLLSYADTTCRLNYLNLFENNSERRGKCGYVSLEDDKELIHHRLYNLRQYFKIKKDNKIIENLKVKCMYGKNFRLAEKNYNKIEINNEAERKLYDFCKDKKFVVIDTLRRLSNLNENDSSEMSHILRCIEKINYETGCAILINAHIGKNKEADGKDKVRGSGSITDDTRFTLLLSKSKNELTLSWEKVNAVKIPEAIPLKWQEWINNESHEAYSMITLNDEETQEAAAVSYKKAGRPRGTKTNINFNDEKDFFDDDED